MPDELTHRLWWKLGDYLRGELTLDDFVAWTGEGDGWNSEVLALIGLRGMAVLHGAVGASAENFREGCEHIHAQLTWEMMGLLP